MVGAIKASWCLLNATHFCMTASECLSDPGRHCVVCTSPTLCLSHAPYQGRPFLLCGQLYGTCVWSLSATLDSACGSKRAGLHIG